MRKRLKRNISRSQPPSEDQGNRRLSRVKPYAQDRCQVFYRRGVLLVSVVQLLRRPDPIGAPVRVVAELRWPDIREDLGISVPTAILRLGVSAIGPFGSTGTRGTALRACARSAPSIALGRVAAEMETPASFQYAPARSHRGESPAVPFI